MLSCIIFVDVDYTAGLDSYHHSGFLRDFLEAFEQITSHKLRPKKERDTFGVLSINSIFITQVLPFSRMKGLPK